MDAAVAYAEAGLAIVRTLGLPHAEALMLACVAETQIASGEIDEQAEAGLERAIEIAANQSDLRVLPTVARARALLAQLRGDTEGFTQRMQEASMLYRAVHETWLADQIDEQLAAAHV